MRHNFPKAPWASLAGFAAVLSLTAASAHAAIGTREYQAKVNGKTRTLRIEALDDDLIHFEITALPAAEGRIWTSPMVAKKDYAGSKRFRAIPNGFETAELRVTVAPGTLCVSTYDLRRAVDLNEVCPLRLEESWKGLSINSPRSKNAYGLGQYFYDAGAPTADGDWIGRVWDSGADSMGNSMPQFANGGGSNGIVQMPMLYALGAGKQGYGIFLDHVYKMMWSFKQTPWRVETFGDQIRWYMLSGASLKDLRKDFLELTGKPPVPPKPVFGLWVGDFGFERWDEIIDNLTSLEKNGFPVDGFALDLQWFGGNFNRPENESRMGTLRFNEAPNAFPNPAQTIAWLRDKHGVRLMPIEESYVSSVLPEHDVMAKQGFLAKDCGTDRATFLDKNPWWGKGGMIDWTNPQAADFWHDRKRAPLARLGLNFHWTDLGEPEMFSPNSCYFGFPELGKTHHSDIHNIFNLRWAESIARGYARNGGGMRHFIMSRSGAAGLQRFGAGLWSGDIAGNMKALTAHMNAQMHVSLVGIDYFGADIGGFHRGPGISDGDQGELYTQWLANSSLFDFPMRPHTWNTDNSRQTAPSRIGHLESNRANVRQRYELLPYYYSLAYRASRNAEPIIPPMVYAFQNDPQVRRMGNQKMIGPSLMAAVVAAYGEQSRPVYLPKGTWIDFRTFEWIASPGKTIGPVPVRRNGLFQIPLYARAGAIIPMAQVDGQTGNTLGFRRDGSRSDLLRVRVFTAPQATAFTLFEDDGLTTEYRKGAVAETRITQQAAAGIASVRIAAAKGRLAGILPTERPVQIEIASSQGAATAVVLGTGKRLPVCKPLTPKTPALERMTATQFGCFTPDPARGLTIVKLVKRPVALETLVRAEYK